MTSLLQCLVAISTKYYRKAVKGVNTSSRSLCFIFQRKFILFPFVHFCIINVFYTSSMHPFATNSEVNKNIAKRNYFIDKIGCNIENLNCHRNINILRIKQLKIMLLLIYYCGTMVTHLIN